MKPGVWIAVGLLALGAAGCQGAGRADSEDAPMVRTKSGLQYQDLRVGNGPSPQPGQMAVVHYTGWLTNG